MALKRMDNMGIVVEDLAAAIAFFRELGMELEGTAMVEGEWAGRVTGLGDQRVEIAMMRMPDGHGRLELSRFIEPSVTGDHRTAPVNALGYLRATDPALPDGTAGSGVASYTAPGTFTTSGSHSVTGTATDGAGNVSDGTSATVHVDAEDPTVGFTTCPADVILNSSTSIPWSASDPSSGIAGAATGSVPLNTATLGTRTETITVFDSVGHQATASCQYRVIYDFQGFFAPLSNTPKLIDVKAGDIVPASFSLGGDQGLGVIAVGFPQSGQVSCTAPAPLSSGLATVASRPLDYSKVNGGRYRYSWQTSKAWAGTCRQFILTLADGTVHRANLRFK